MTKTRIAFIMLLVLFVPSMGWAQIQVGPGQMYPNIGAADDLLLQLAIRILFM